PSCLAACEVLGRAEVEKVHVICENNDRMRVSLKVVPPCFQSMDDSEKFLIIDLIITFCGIKRLREIPARVIGAIFISLEDCSSGNEGSISSKGELSRGVREALLQFLEGVGTCLCPLELDIFLGEIKQGSGKVRVMGNEVMVEVAESKERADFFHRSWYCPITYSRKLGRVHCYLSWSNDHSEIINFLCIEGAFFRF
ncbi:hypothetical protein CY34DRAFT_97224, partial [Suillus luteus UH-Slu-Lm8-n1]